VAAAQRRDIEEGSSQISSLCWEMPPPWPQEEDTQPRARVLQVSQLSREHLDAAATVLCDSFVETMRFQAYRYHVCVCVRICVNTDACCRMLRASRRDIHVFLARNRRHSVEFCALFPNFGIFLVSVPPFAGEFYG
jgi:hypothetical protein